MCEHCRTYAATEGFALDPNAPQELDLNFARQVVHKAIKAGGKPVEANDPNFHFGSGGVDALHIPDPGGIAHSINHGAHQLFDSGSKGFDVFQHDIKNIEDAFGKGFGGLEKVMPWILIGLFGVGLYFLVKKV